MRRQEDNRYGPRPVLLLSLAIAIALALTAAATLRHDAPPAAAIGENSLAFPDPHPTDNIGTESSMQLDSNGFPVVAYTAQIPGATAVRLLHCNDVVCAGGDDSIETVFSSTSGIVNPSLSLDTSGNPIITFLHGGINVMHCNDANCDGNDESLVTPVVGCCELYSSHVLAAGDLPVIVFRQNGLQIVRCANTNCTAVTNDPGFIVQPEPTSSNSITLDAAGLPVIAYSGADGLRLLHCNDINCAGGDESVQSLDGSLTGRHTAIKLVDGNPVIAYTGNTSGTSQIKIARCDDPACAPGGDTFQFLTSEIVGSNSAPGLAIDAAGNPVVSYYREHNQTHVIHCNDPACAGGDESQVLTAAAGGSGAANGATSVALDVSGRPVVSLYAASGNDLAILHCGDVNCSIPPLPTPTNTATFTSTPPPATATNTPLPSTATHTPTSTPVPPTATSTRTSTPVPATHTQTNTPVPPTATFTSTNTPVPPTATNTAVAATATNTPLPPTATATPVGDRCADINGNGRVNGGDLVRIFKAMFRPYNARFDINRDGAVTFADLFAAARQYGRSTC